MIFRACATWGQNEMRFLKNLDSTLTNSVNVVIFIINITMMILKIILSDMYETQERPFKFHHHPNHPHHHHLYHLHYLYHHQGPVRGPREAEAAVKRIERCFAAEEARHV